MASGFPSFAGPSPSFVVFPEIGWNCSLEEKETELHRAFLQAGKRLKDVNLMSNSFTPRIFLEHRLYAGVGVMVPSDALGLHLVIFCHGLSPVYWA